MDRKRSVPRLAATGAVIAGLAAGSYGIAKRRERWRHHDDITTNARRRQRPTQR